MRRERLPVVRSGSDVQRVPRIALAYLRATDVNAIYLNEDAETVQWLSLIPGTRTSIRRYIHGSTIEREVDGTVHAFGIRLLSTNQLIGTLEMRTDLAFLAPGQVNLAYGVFPRWRGQGYATEAVRMASQRCLSLPGYDSPVIRCHPANLASIAVARKAGFAFLKSTDDEHGRFDWFAREETDS